MVSHGGTWCAVRGCKTNTKHKTVSMFGFPRDLERCKIWIENIERKDLLKLNDKQLHHKKVCANHFEEKMFLNDLKNRLHNHAVPTICISMQLAPESEEDIEVTCNSQQVKKGLAMEKATEPTLSRLCAIPTCRARSNNLSFFSFPRDKTRALEWIEKCQRKDLPHENLSILSKNTHLCSKHFENHMFLNDLKNRLHSHAVPTLFLPTPDPYSSTSEPDPLDITVPQQDTEQDHHQSSTCVDSERRMALETHPEVSVCNLSSEDEANSITSEMALQTNKSLTSNSPMKHKLKIALETSQKRTKLQGAPTTTPGDLQHFLQLCDTFLSPELALIVKFHAKRKHTSKVSMVSNGM